MKNVLKLDNVRVKLQSRDLDKDGITDEVETLTHKDQGIAEIKETTELKDAITDFNKDEKNIDGLSSIDFNGRVENLFEMPPLIALDSCVGLRVIPSRSALIGRVKMRKNVAFKGAGRKEYVDLVVGKKQADAAAATQKVMNYAGMGNG